MERITEDNIKGFIEDIKEYHSDDLIIIQEIVEEELLLRERNGQDEGFHYLVYTYAG